MNSFIPWIGGKSQLREKILAYFPKEKPTRYVEVFGGAGWVLFARPCHAPLEVFNDFDGQLINLYRCIRCHPQELQRELSREDLSWLPNSRKLFFESIAQLEAPGLTPIQRAARYFYIIRTSFGADRRSFSCHKTYLEKPMERLPEIGARLKDVIIESQDFEKILGAYDRPGALLYLDPPYYKAERGYQGFGPEDHIRLRKALGGVKGRFLLSYNDCPEVRALYQGFTLHEMERGESLTNKTGKRALYGEVLVANY